MKKFTFKIERSTGRYSSFFSDCMHIKLNQKEVGSVSNKDFKIRFKIKKEPTKEEPASFKWIALKGEFKSFQEVKEFVKFHSETIQSKYDLYQE